jgi:uncharacterized protein
MNAMRPWILVPVIVVASALSAPAEIIDNARLFTPATLQKAEAKLDRTEQLTKIPVRIETVESLQGANPDQAAERKARQWGKPGVFVFIAKNEKKIQVRDFHVIGNRGDDEIRQTFINSFKANDFDGGLIQGVDVIGDVLATATPATRRAGRQPGGQFPPGQQQRQKKSAFPWWVTALLIVAIVWIGLRVLGGLFRGGNQMAGQGGMQPQGGPGFGGGYGGRGGGFMSSLFGGIGGAMAGNWLYDQFSGRHHGPGNMYPDQTNYDQGSSPADDPSTGSWGGGGGDWGGGDGGGDWGGGGGDGGGGDW